MNSIRENKANPIITSCQEPIAKILNQYTSYLIASGQTFFKKRKEGN